MASHRQQGSGLVLIPDADILEARVAARFPSGLPWVIPAVVILAMTDEDLDRLEAASDTPYYWTILNEVVARIEREAS